MADDDPADVASQNLPRGRLRRPSTRSADRWKPGGDPGQATRDAVSAHYRENYRPQDLVITAAGAVDHDALVADVTKALDAAGWDLGRTARPVERGERTNPVTRRSHLVVENRPIEQVHVLIGLPGLRHRPIDADHGRAQFDARWRHVVAALPGDPREAWVRLFGVLVLRPLLGLRRLRLYAGCSPAKVEQVTDLMLASCTPGCRGGYCRRTRPGLGQLSVGIGARTGGLRYPDVAARPRRDRPRRVRRPRRDHFAPRPGHPRRGAGTRRRAGSTSVVDRRGRHRGRVGLAGFGDVRAESPDVPLHLPGAPRRAAGRSTWTSGRSALGTGKSPGDRDRCTD